MPKKLFNERKRLIVYIGAVNYIHLSKRAGGKGKIGAWVRALVERELFKA